MVTFESLEEKTGSDFSTLRIPNSFLNQGLTTAADVFAGPSGVAVRVAIVALSFAL